ncbi:MAG: hypothetical protein U9O56_03405 [Campylobacterota bacterium]|nr:hypothetical protein [Campylobacterota bacterium]
MSYGISVKENLDSFTVKQKLVENINKLSPSDVAYLEEQMFYLIDKSVHKEETIDESNVDRNFITFLIRLFY